MITVLISGLLCGMGVGAALCISYIDYRATKLDEKLRLKNAELEAEVVRLRAQVALHINPDPPMTATEVLALRAAHPIGLRTAA